MTHVATMAMPTSPETIIFISATESFHRRPLVSSLRSRRLMYQSTGASISTPGSAISSSTSAESARCSKPVAAMYRGRPRPCAARRTRSHLMPLRSSSAWYVPRSARSASAIARASGDEAGDGGSGRSAGVPSVYFEVPWSRPSSPIPRTWAQPRTSDVYCDSVICVPAGWCKRAAVIASRIASHVGALIVMLSMAAESSSVMARAAA
mmetsp:Transcript_17126/g.37067  ORF Transcript_17126/g.37067 Transcript_17126/m.37067 type:complete len:208 (-) Transcript_17126:44-667(-)